jgi:hypothetical protein
MHTATLSGTTALFISRGALSASRLPPTLRARAGTAPEQAEGRLRQPLVVALASEVLGGALLPAWSGGTDVHFLVLADVPEPALMRLPAVLRLHRPDLRLHVTRDFGVLRRLLIAWSRAEAMRGIVDAYAVAGELCLMLGDGTLRGFPLDGVPGVRELPARARAAFEVDEDGSFLHWPEGDLHLGVSQLLQAFDPMHLADVEIERSSRDHWGRAVALLREARGLRQKDVRDLSERQVRRIEQGISRLTEPSARAFADAFGVTLGEFLDEVARRASALAKDSAA